MNARTGRLLGPARAVTLALVAAAAAGLTYLHVDAGTGRTSVPAGARPGQLTLHRCSYDTERGSYAADCGTLVVRENRHDPQSRLIALPVTRIRARSGAAGAPVFRLQGGPGLSNMHFADASRFADRHDVVLVGYRGVDGSSRLDCPEVTSAMKHASDLLGRAYFDSAARAYRACAARLASTGVDLGGYSLPERADDLDAARRALGYERIDLLSESAGTRTALIYAWRYPTRVARSVMIGVNPPGNYVWHPAVTDEQIRKYASLCAKDPSCSRRTGDLAATLRENANAVPGHWWFLPIEKGNVRVATFFGLMNATSAASPLSAGMTLDTVLSAAKGDAAGSWLMSTLAGLAIPERQVWGDVAAVGRVDAAAADRYFSSPGHGRGSIIGNPGSDFLLLGGRITKAWPAGPDDNAYSTVRTSRVPTLLIGGDLDVATPPQTATRELLPHLPNGRQVVLPGLGHTDDVWSYEPEASSHLVNTFLDTGRVDTSLYTPRTVDFTPGTTQGDIAKIVLAAMLGLGALAAISLVWLPWRSLRRGGFGRRSSAVLRSVYPAVLGLGGWLVGVLIVLVAFPTVPLDDELLGVAATGIPVGIGIASAWLRAGLTGRTRSTGVAAALAGALLGAWLGLHATDGLLAVSTAILGAAAGANLAVLAVDVGRDVVAGGAAATSPAASTAWSPTEQSGRA